MFRTFLRLMALLFLGCTSSVKPEQVNQIEGYWKIDYISHGSEKFYPRGAEKLLDFYEINEMEGIRKKVQPEFGNKFSVTEDFNNFKIIFEGDNCFIKFQTPWDQWTEKIILLTEEKLILEHQEKKYHYLRYSDQY